MHSVRVSAGAAGRGQRGDCRSSTNVVLDEALFFIGVQVDMQVVPPPIGLTVA
jgi:hypothetical protein